MSPSADSALQLVAHRGNAHEFPENTLPALRSALELGINHVEFDVHLSADEIPVVMHDANLLRCAGQDRDALAMNWDELREIPVGETQRFGGRYADVCIPSLAQVVELLGNSPKAVAFVELKRASLQKFGMEQMVRNVFSVLKPVLAQVVMISFDLTAIHFAKQSMGLQVGWVLSEYNSLSRIKAEATLPHFLFCDQMKLPAETPRLWRGPWHWAMYEVTTRADALALQSRGAQFVETMQVRRMLRELRAT